MTMTASKPTALYGAIAKTPTGHDATKRVLDYVRAGGTPHSGGICMRRSPSGWELVGPDSRPVFRGTLAEAATALVNMAGSDAIRSDLVVEIPIAMEV